MLCLGIPAVLFLLPALALQCFSRVQWDRQPPQQAPPNPLPARAPQTSTACHPIARLWDDSITILMHTCSQSHSSEGPRHVILAFSDSFCLFFLFATDGWECGGLLGCCLGPHLGAHLQARDKDKEEEKSCPALLRPLSSQEQQFSGLCLHRA